MYRTIREVSKTNTTSLAQPLSEDGDAARKQLEEALVWLHRFLDSPAQGKNEKDRSLHHRARAFQLLLAHLGVLLYAGDDDVPGLIQVRSPYECTHTYTRARAHITHVSPSGGLCRVPRAPPGGR